MPPPPSASPGPATPTGTPSDSCPRAAVPCAPARCQAADGGRAVASAEACSLHPPRCDLAGGGVEYVHPARHAGVERVNGAQNLDRPLGVDERVVVHQGRLVGSGYALAVTR